MAQAITPIVAGAQYRDVSTSETHGDVIRVKSVWVDEDMSVQVQILEEDEYINNPTSRTISLDDLVARIDDEIIRVNSDHDAWEWRQ